MSKHAETADFNWFNAKIGDFGVKPVKISGFSMLAHACSCVLTYSFLSLNRVSRYCICVWRTKIGKFVVKPVKISGFSMLAHACSCLLMCVHVCSLILFCH